MNKTVKLKLLVTGNLIAFVATVIINSLANALPLNGLDTGELSDAIPNLFVPSGLTFSIWAVIYLLLLSFVVYQIVRSAQNSAKQEYLDQIGPWFMISCAANIAWIFAWHWQQIAVSLIIMLLLLASLLMIYLRLKTGIEKVTKEKWFFIQLPFSVYLGWITVATIANVTALLVTAGWNGFGISEALWTVIVLIVAIGIGLAVLITRRDVGYTLVIIWAFLGIYLKRSSTIPQVQEVIVTSMVGIIVLAIALVIQIILSLKKKTT
jgi:hypothetical protein